MAAQPSVSSATPEDIKREAAGTREPAVLLAEDKDANLKLLLLHLSFLDCRFLIARTGQDAVAAFRDHDVDLVLMDIMMPVMDGFEATKRIRRMERESGAAPMPIIAVTAHVDPCDQHLCIRAGMNDYLPKPVSGADLRRAIAIWAPALRKGQASAKRPLTADGGG